MEPSADSVPVFLCDAMLGGLARWLRAAGYDTHFEYGIDDDELLRRADANNWFVLTSDGPLFDRNAIKTGQVRALYVPQQLSRRQQLRFVLARLDLPRRPGRCMACGGELDEQPKHTVADEAPPLAFRNCHTFWRCRRCGKLLWHGTHWNHVSAVLADIREDL